MKIAYVDEEENQSHEFIRSANKSGHFKAENVIPFLPKPRLKTMVEELLSTRLDGLVIDFKLDEKDRNVEYDGFALRDEIIKRNKFLPCIIITSYLPDAFSNKNDVWIIADKKDVNNDSSIDEKSSGFGFFDKLILSIEKSKNDLKKTNKRYYSLLNKYDNDDIKEIEFDELIELDSSLEYYLNEKNRFAKDIKRRDHAPYIQLIKNANILADKLGKDLANKKKPDME